jgi:ubiquinone/menaquinone biosynthesis C-methylase UbiE
LELAQQADTVIGIDISHTALDFANRVKEYLQCTQVFFQQSDAEQLAFADNSFDLVICSEVLEHVLNPRQALAEIRRVVKPGGTVIVTTPCAVSLSDLTMKALRLLFPHLESEQDVQFDKKTYLALQRKRQTSPEKASQSQEMLPEAVFLRVHERFHYRTLVNMFREAGFSVQRATGTILAFPPHYQAFYRLCPGWLLSGIRILENVFNNIGVFQRFGSVTTCFQLLRS